MPALDDHDRQVLAAAREMAAVPANGVREYTGEDDGLLARAVALARAQILLAELAAVVTRLAGDDGADGAEDARRLHAIREVLRHFDWEYHDRQLALEAIERIADGGQP